MYYILSWESPSTNQQIGAEFCFVPEMIAWAKSNAWVPAKLVVWCHGWLPAPHGVVLWIRQEKEEKQEEETKEETEEKKAALLEWRGDVIIQWNEFG